MSNLRTSDGETGDARFEFGNLIEPDNSKLSAEPMTFYFHLLQREQIGLSLSYRKMPAMLGVNVNVAARCKGGTVSGRQTPSYRDGNNPLSGGMCCETPS